MYRAIRYAGKSYQNALAQECIRLGYEIEMKRSDKGEITGFEIRGVPEDVLRRCSRRREQIDREIEKFVAAKGRQPTPDEVKLMTLLTRGRKMLEKTTDQVTAFKMSLFTEEERSNFRSMASEAEQLSFLMLPRPKRAAASGARDSGTADSEGCRAAIRAEWRAALGCDSCRGSESESR